MARLSFATAALLAACLAVAQAQREYRIMTGHDIPGYDIPSPDGKPFTKVCIPPGSNYKGKTGGFDAWKQICDDTPGCVAAVAPTAPDGCVYLKTKGTRDVFKADPKWVALTSQEKPSSCAKFANLGDGCTTDIWADAQTCCGGNHNKCLDGKCATTFPTPAAQRQWRYVNRHDIPGNDIPSGGKSFTQWCTPNSGYYGKIGYDAYQIRCNEVPGCVAVVMSNKEPGCVYLKTKGKRGDMKASDEFAVLTSQEPPQKACTFSANGEGCTTDPWVDQPICCGGNHVKCNNGVCESTFPRGRRLAM